MTKLNYTKQAPHKGSTIIIINANTKDGRPFGQLWTFKNTHDTWHPWHAMSLVDVEHKTFFKGVKGRDLKAAKAFLESKV